MKKISNLFENTNAKLDIQDNTMSYISKNDLEKFLEVTKKFLSDDAKYVINYLIDNNDTYVKEFGKEGNALANFYNKGIPTNKELKPLYKAIGELKKNGKLLEIPVFLNKEQFDAIIKGKISLDSIVLDLETEAGRNKIAKDYTPLIHKIAKQLEGVGSKTDYNDLISAGYEALTMAMNDYGKSKKKSVEKDIESIDNSEDKDLNKAIEDSADSQDEVINKKSQYTFTSYAAFRIRFHMIAEITDNSRTIKVSKYLQKKDREAGKSLHNTTISGDAVAGVSKDGTSKTVFDYISDYETSKSGTDESDMKYLWSELYTALEKEFSEDDIDCFYSFYGLNDHTDEKGNPIKGKELAAKYKTSQSNITYRIQKIIKYILKNPKLKDMITDIYTMYKECLHDEEYDAGPDKYNYIIDQSESTSIYDYE